MSALPPDEPTPAQRWFALAEEDLAAARVLIADGSAALRIAGFLSQQAAEKALKAGLFAALRVVEAVRTSEPSVTPDL
jgi:HEPN domain-containing protein